MLYVEKLFQSLQPLYDQPWFPYALGIVGALFGWSVFKSLRALPKLVMYPIIMATAAIVLMNWVFNRNEPELISPLIDFIAPWLPARV